MKQTGYIVLVGKTADELAVAVGKAQADGWNCQGGVSSFGGYDVKLYQVMVKWEQAMATITGTTTFNPCGSILPNRTKPGSVSGPVTGESVPADSWEFRAEQAIAAHSTAISGLHEKVAKVERFAAEMRAFFAGRS